MTANSPDFDRQWLETQIASAPEDAFIDFKAEPPKKDKSEEDEFKFAKHLIAFGNIARSTGLPCHIIFGVDDKTRIEKDLRDFCAQRHQPPYWQNPDTTVMKKQSDGVEQPILDIAHKWIKPEIPKISLQYGEISNGIFLSYLIIKPTNTTEPFFLAKSCKTFNQGAVFIRKGANSVIVNPSEVTNLLPVSKAAYLSRSEWQMFFNWHSTGEFEAAQSLLPVFNHKTRDDKDALSEILMALDANKRTILIKGAAGEGKTTLLRRISYHLTQSVDLKQISLDHFGQEGEKVDEDTYVVMNVHTELSTTPTMRIPIYMSLRIAFDSVPCLEKHFLKQIEEITGKYFEKPDLLFSINKSSWVILLDGVDEIRNLITAGPLLHSWLALLPRNVQVILTSRPHVSPIGITDITIELAPLQETDILYLVKGKIETSIHNQSEAVVEETLPLADKTVDFIRNKPALLEFLNRHRAIDGLLLHLDINIAHPDPMEDIADILVNKTEVKITEGSGSGNLPLLGNSQSLEHDDVTTYLDNTQPSNIDEPEVESKLDSLAKMLYDIYEYMQSTEIGRQNEFGFDAQKDADLAAFQLGEASWCSNWRQPELNVEEVKHYLQREAVNWNEFAGFIKHKKYPQYSFCCPLFQQFVIAQHGEKHQQKSTVIEHVNRNGGAKQAEVQQIINLYNELCYWHGNDEIQFQ